MEQMIQTITQGDAPTPFPTDGDPKTLDSETDPMVHISILILRVRGIGFQNRSGIDLIVFFSATLTEHLSLSQLFSLGRAHGMEANYS